MKPLLEWRDRMGRVSATYNPALRKYFLCVTDGRTTISKYNTYILEADEITGPWRLVTYMRDFGDAVNVKLTADVSMNGGTFALTSGMDFTGKTVNIIDKPKWVKSVQIVNGDIVATIKSAATVIYVR